MSTAQKAVQYAKKHFPKTLADLKKLSAIPSVSFDGFDPRHVEASARETLRILRESGLENCRMLRMDRVFPYVYGEWLGAGKDAPTVLLYAHHDVQPPMQESLWKSPPFKPTERNGRLYGRGTCDDKAGVLLHAASVAAYLKTAGSVPVNVKVIIEGEEEVGSPNLHGFLKRHKSLLKSDVMVLADATNYDTGVPSLTTSLRGIVVLELECRALDHSLHSGMWSGPIPDPVMALSKALSTMVDASGDIAIPGFCDDVTPVSALEKRHLAALKMTDAVFRKQSGMEPGVRFWQSKGSHLEKLWRQPTITVNSFIGGDRKNAGNVILDGAWARVSVRLAPGQDPKRVETLLTNHLLKHMPWGVKLAVKSKGGAPAWMTRVTHPAYSLAAEALARGYGKKTVFIGCGGSIPFVEAFVSTFGEIPILLVGVEDPYGNAHSENESLDLRDFQKSILGQIHCLEALQEMNSSRRG